MAADGAFGFSATGIGSVPFGEMEETCRRILSLLPDIPYWPQFVRINPIEDMMLQFTEGLPMLQVDRERRSVSVSQSSHRESELTRLYERFLAEDLSFFAIGRQYAPGLFIMLELIKEGLAPEGRYLKGQTVGPFTLAAGVMNLDGKSILHDPELFDAVTSGLCAKALWQIRTLSSSGRRAVLFLDEPYLSGFGSAFCPVERGHVIEVLRKFIGYLKERSDAAIGIHCCGNTDWAMLMESGADIINFDAFGYMEHFFLYPKEISSFLAKGGAIAWGIVPTSAFDGSETSYELSSLLEKGIESLSDLGIDADIIRQRSLLTPACGMGSMKPSDAEKALRILAEISSERQGRA
jgi:methionine synthase II (cobalamin-independent)